MNRVPAESIDAHDEEMSVTPHHPSRGPREQPRPLEFTPAKGPGWCSLCRASHAGGVRVRHADTDLFHEICQLCVRRMQGAVLLSS